MDQAQRQLLEKVLRRVHSGLKTFQLYSATHASAQVTVQDVAGTLRGYLQRYGAVALQVNKDRLLVDGIPLSEGSMNTLAFFLYVRNLASIAVLPGVTDREVGALLSILAQDRQVIESAGGVERLALSQDLPHITIKAMALSESADALSEAGIVDALIRTRRLSPEQRDVVFSMLRDGPAATAALLVSVQKAAGGTSTDGKLIDVEHLLIALETLDRAILDEPVEDQEILLQSLAQGVLQQDAGVRAALAPELLSQAVEGGSGRAILGELTGQEIALIVLGPVGQGDVAARLTKFLTSLRLREGEAAEVTAFLGTALNAGGTKLGSFAASPGGVQLQPAGPEKDVWAAVDPSLLAFGPRDEAALGVLRNEASERAVTLEAIKGQINLLGLQERPEEIMETAKALAGHLTFLADNQQMDMLTITLPMLQEARGRADVHRGAIDAELARVLNAGLLDRLVRDALQTHADASDDLLQALVAVRDHTVPHLIRMLERRPADAQRVELCNLMTKICAGQAGLIGSRLPGASPHLARDLVFVLGELRDPAAAGYLARLAAHPEYLVRREAIDALRKMPSDQSRGALVEFFRDPDPRIQYSLIEGAEVAHDERIMTWMQDAIRSPDWTPGAIAVKVAAMKALARMRADGALPLLRRIARTRWVFGQGRRTVRQAARRIVDDWERSRQRPA